MTKQATLYLMRHLGARDSILVGNPAKVVGAPEGTTSIVGNGIHPDAEAHLQGSEYAKAEEIGESLYVPQNIKSVLILPSPKPRADETARHMFIGMARKYAKNVLGLEDLTSPEAKIILSKKGLHRLTAHKSCDGLDEIDYKDYNGLPDEGNELVAQAYCPEVNPDFPGYKWMVQKGFEGDPRSEHPQSIADRALRKLVPALNWHSSLTLAVSHQPNIEIITAALTGNLGKDANELWENAGGAYALGSGFRLTTEYDLIEKSFKSAKLKRTSGNQGADFKKEIDVNLEVLNGIEWY
ncbi:MAG: hypothetical protein KAT77_04805 [Nanoarchaeota archaeon]|nr:hypothetical protein [Nanoarchaeota archaeon]